MITNHQYKKAKAALGEAQKLIQKYEAQQKAIRNEKFPQLDKNDYIRYIGGSKSKYLTKGKKYRLTCKPWNGRVAIINDNNKRVVLRNHLFQM